MKYYKRTAKMENITENTNIKYSNQNNTPEIKFKL